MLETILEMLIALVGVLILVLGYKLWPTLKAVIDAWLPSWATNILVTAADMFVWWAETKYKDKEKAGEEKYYFVLEKLEAFLAGKNIRFDADAVRAAIEAAWSKMNLEQVAAGVKGAGEEKEE